MAILQTLILLVFTSGMGRGAAHEHRLSAAVFHPQSGVSLSPTAANLVSAAADGSVHLWNLERYGHEMRAA